MAKAKEDKTKQKATLVKVLRYLKPYWFYLGLSLVLAAVSVALTLYVPKLTGRAIDHIIARGQVDFPAILAVLKQIAIAIAVTALAQWIMNICNNKMTYHIVRDIRNEAFRKIEILPLKYIDSHSYGEIVSRVIADVDQFADGLLMGFTQFFTGVMTIAGTILFMLATNVGITFVVVLITPLSLFVAAFIAKKTFTMFRLQSETRGEQTALIDEMLGNQKVVQAFSHEEKAMEQARVAVEHFKEDFIYKIRSAIKEAYIRRDELNRIIRKLNFGKDRYQFRISKNKGLDGEYYDMFMDESLEIDPATLSGSVEHQINMFSMDHENRYGTLMNDLIHIFIPPENASAREQEEAKKNMEKYADYRTYLSFEMEQIVEGEERLVIGLSKMIKKNSGGEGQNPLYVALLASFAQAYHINLSPKLSRRPTIRLVVLDEAFSKMDAEKVASCIELIRGLGFQAIISATNDKIQNYLENVDKTFVYANPNKRSISIQEFEKKDFSQLMKEEL